ncbi:FMN-dependent dehydrogenase-domain-containing protein [Aspergillus minisclerotigenes]|uniref:L-lactate dehydrogenase (cytochrome) n=1 Tax=Aspergillus minisclerotigenes TaxID=656917 RepID=A0A5N6J781_9EURO|nr:FMN-dependent dehydrogenase-domain-containing protein [Aspergillus minisclerotigenes]
MRLTRAEVEGHNSKASCWVAIHGSVYDVTDFVDSHPGGPNVILRCAGKDATEDFDSVHEQEILTQSLAPSALRGHIEPGTLLKSNDINETKIPNKDASLPPPLSSLLNLHDFEIVAEKHLPPNAWAYYASGAEDEISKRQNSKAFQKVSLRPRILRSIPTVDTTTTILGKQVSLPVYMSAVGIAKLAHPDGERALAAAAGKEGLAQVLANGANNVIESVMDARTSPEQPIFQQLYVNRDITKSEDVVRRAERAGASAIWITVDSPVVGKREMDERFNLQVEARDDPSRKGQGVAKTMANFISPFIDWDILLWLRGLTKLPIVIKGIQCVEDAVQAYHCGVQGIVLSNHGGRSQDTAQAPLLTLLEIRRYAPFLIESKMQIFIDGGIRRGTDVLKAIALGATAVGLGRPTLYSLAAGYGEQGVRRAVEILRQEIESNMVFLGVTNLKELGPHLLNTARLERDVVGSVKLYIGSFYAFILTRNDRVRLTVVARSNYDAVKENGIFLDSGNHGQHRFRPHNDLVIKSLDEVSGPFDYVVCAHKAIDQEAVVTRLQPAINEKTTIVIIQNGVGNEEPFRNTFPMSSIITCVTWVGATQTSPGTVKHTKSEDMQIGLFPNASVDETLERTRLNTFASLLEEGGTKFQVLEDMQRQRWEKVVWNAAWNPLTTLTLLDTQSWLHSSTDATPLTRRLMREVIDVGRRCGVPLEYGLVDELMDRINSLPGVGSSMQTDFKNGRPMEVDVILGFPAKKSKEFGMETPVLDMIHALIRAVDGRVRASL